MDDFGASVGRARVKLALLARGAQRGAQCLEGAVGGAGRVEPC